MIHQERKNDSASQAAQPDFDAVSYSIAKRELQVTGFQYLLGLHQFRGNEFVVDLACGDGGVTVKDLSPLVPSGKVYGVDISTGMIAAARALSANNVEFFAGDIESLSSIEGLPLKPEGVDIFVSNYGMHWVLGRERMRAFLSQVYELTKPGGLLLSLFAENRIFPGFFERMGEVCARPKWAEYFDGGTFRHHPLPELESFGEDVRSSGFRIEILKLREGWITFDSKASLVRGVIGWLPQYMNKLPSDLRQEFAAEVVEHYAQSVSGISNYPKYEGDQIGVYDFSIVLKASK